MIDSITTLAHDIEERWRAHDYRRPLFPELCRQALSEARPIRRFGFRQLIDALPALERCAPHPAAGALTLFRSSRISIFAHLWVDGIGTPHHHAWSGAFQVLRGSAIHTTFDFEERHRVSPRLRFGQLTTRRIDLLGAGEVVPVVPGAGYIHGLWHVDRPGLSLSVRSVSSSDESTLDYRLPGVAWQQRPPGDAIHQVLKLLDVLYQTSVDRYREALDKLVREASPETVYLALVHAVSVLGDFDSVDLILAAARTRQGEPFESLEAYWDELHRTALFQRARRNLRDPHLRFFFGALYFAQDRAAIRDLVARRFPGRDAEELIARWIAEVVDPGVSRERQEPAEGRLTARLFRLMTQGYGFEECFALLHRGSGRCDEPSADSVREVFLKIRGAALFRPLFAAAA